VDVAITMPPSVRVSRQTIIGASETGKHIIYSCVVYNLYRCAVAYMGSQTDNLFMCCT